MRNVLSVLPPTFCVFFLFFNLCHAWIATPYTPRYLAVDNIAINCGNSDNSTAMDGRMWIGDEGSEFSPVLEYDKNSTFQRIRRPNSKDPVQTIPYTTARQSYFKFTYVFPVTPGPKFVRLHFSPGDYLSEGGVKDLFTVKAGNEFYASINGIEIVSMPYHLYYSGQEEYGSGIPYIGQTGRVYISSEMALETVYRLNVGSSTSISPPSDTGMFREWPSDNIKFWLGEENAINLGENNLMLKYSKIPNYTAPDDLYRSATSMGSNKTRNLLSNLTWGLPVASGFNYLVRLHFCELEPEITKVGERPFTIYIDNQTAEEAADVIMWSGSRDTPVFRDYVVMMGKKGVQVNSTLFIALHPGKATDLIYDAILNGVEVLKLSDTRRNLAEPNPINVNSLLPPVSTGTRHESKLKNTIIIVTGSGGGFLILLTLMWFITRKTNSYGSYGSPQSKYSWCWPDPSKSKSTGTKASLAPVDFCRHFSLGEIKTATRNFHEELIVGVGGFGNVYKGLIDKGTVTVAIKRLNRQSRQGVCEFRTEIEMLSRLRHVHLVSLIGYCEEEGEMILVYDYMANGTLRHHLYDIESNHFPWKQRLKICIGAARGLHYLHTGANHPIIHRDVKTTNILLDKDWVAKVSDFGLSKMSVDNSEVSTMVKGTWGYLDPDYAIRQKLSEKSDVYSFGVVLWEVLCARKTLDQTLEEEQWNLANWAIKCIERGSIGKIIDPYLKGKIAPKSFKVYVEVAEGCVREQGIQRPTMDDVMEKLRFALELQENEDTAIDKLNSADGLPYPDMLSYHYVVYNEHASEMGSETKLTTTSICELTCLTRDSGTIQSHEEGTRDGPIEVEDSTTH